MAENFSADPVQLEVANVLSGTADPTTGVTAPIGSLYLRASTPGENWIKTGAGDTAWTQVSTGSAGGLTLVSAQTISGSAVDRFTFSGLDGDADGQYEIWWYLVRSATPFAVQIRPNGLTSNLEGIVTDMVGVGAPSQTANDRLEWTLGMQRTQAWGQIRFWADRNGGTAPQLVRGGHSEAGEHQLDAGGNMRRWLASGYWNENTTNITSLELVAVSGTGTPVTAWGVGSQATLWKRTF